MTRLIVVSNRVSPPTGTGEETVGGLAMALAAALREYSGLWFGWSGKTAKKFTGQLNLEKVEGVTTATIDLFAGDPGDRSEQPRGWARYTDGQILILDPRDHQPRRWLPTAHAPRLGLIPTPQGAFLYLGEEPRNEYSPQIANLPSPFLPENDEEKGDTPSKIEPKKDAAFTIDLAGINQRILAFPLPTGSYSGLSTGAAGAVFYLTRPEGATSATLNRL